MPFIKFDPEMLQGMLQGMLDEVGTDSQGMPGPDGAYVPADAMRYLTGDEKIDEIARATINALLGAGVTKFRVRYDGGHDEGFAHADALFFGGKWAPVNSVRGELARPEIASAIRNAGNSVREGYFHENSDVEVVTEAIDWLAETLTGLLLGRGFGTGEYSMYGVFSADLKTLEMTDDPGAQPPAD